MPVTDDQSIKELLGLEPVAVVGCSRTPGKDAHEVPAYLVSQGIDVIPVNPFADEIFGRRAYDILASIDRDIALVDVFRPSGEVPGLVNEAIERSDVKAIWLQVGIINDAALERAERAGLITVQDRCMRTEHRRLHAQ